MVPIKKSRILQISMFLYNDFDRHVTRDVVQCEWFIDERYN